MTKPSRPTAAPPGAPPVTIETGAVEHAEGSCLITQGGRASRDGDVEEKVPPFLRDTGEGGHGGVRDAPRATLERSPREAARGKQSGRTLEIQRLIGRPCAASSTGSSSPRTVTLDCDVLVADAGTRCASVTGAWVALALAVAGWRSGGS